MNLTGSAFLHAYGPQFSHPVVAGWVWEADDDIFGKSVSWSLGRSDLIDAQATVDLSAGQLQLTITERPLGDADSGESNVVFNALVSFDDRTITFDGADLPYEDAVLHNLIAAFNEQT